GVSAGSPAIQVPITGAPTPYLCYWSATGMVEVPMTWGTNVPAVSFPTVTATDASISSGSVTVSITPTLKLEPTATASNLPPNCTSVCTASATVGSPVQGDIVYVVTQGSTTIADLDVHVDLGQLAVNTSYQAAP
ncbi:MAG: hypothetical protein ACYDB3_05885, partial [Acidimicrobiales bacterium]